jgi:hypothetical protein
MEKVVVLRIWRIVWSLGIVAAIDEGILVTQADVGFIKGYGDAFF